MSTQSNVHAQAQQTKINLLSHPYVQQASGIVQGQVRQLDKTVSSKRRGAQQSGAREAAGLGGAHRNEGPCEALCMARHKWAYHGFQVRVGTP